MTDAEIANVTKLVSLAWLHGYTSGTEGLSVEEGEAAFGRECQTMAAAARLLEPSESNPPEVKVD